MDFDEIVEELFGDAFLKNWSEPSLSDVFTHPQLRTKILDMLHPKWIASLPEFLGVLGALRRMQSPPPDKETLENALTLLEQTSELAQTGDGWERYKAIWLGEGAETRVETTGYAVADAREGDVSKLCYEYDEPTPYSATIPHDFPIREQREGSCVAQALGTMLEFLLGETCDEFATKILYETARNRDGIRAPDGGTNLRTMISWLQDGPREQRLWNAGLLCLNQRDLYTMKKTLVGASGRRPSPVVAAFTLFETSCHSVAAQRSGKWTLPISGETPIGAHALVIFGYRDDPSAVDVGGGYFIARNSWGEEYACDSPIKKPGYSLIPYAYVVRYCLEAYAADIPNEEPAGSKASVDAPKDEFESRYVWSLEEKTVERYEDAEGKVRELRLLNPGVEVVGRHDDPTFVKEYTPENRQEFVKRGYGWSRTGRVRRFFPAVGVDGKIDAALSARTDDRLAAQASFMNGIAANVAKLSGRKSTLTRGVFGTPNFRVEEKPLDLSKEVRGAMATANGLPTGLFDGEDVPKEYRDTLRASVSTKLWRIDGGKGAIVACFVAPLAFAPERDPEFVAATEALAKKLAGTIRSKVDETTPKPEVVCVAFGSLRDEPEIFVNAASSDFDLVSGSVLKEFDLIAGRRWRPTFSATRDERLTPFRKALNPTTLDENAQIVRTIVDDPTFFGDATLERVSRKLDGALSEEELKESLDELIRHSEYEYYKTGRGEDAIRLRKIR